MLVLTRKDSEKVVVGEPGSFQLTVTVIEIQGNKVRLGFEAPPDVPIHREEVYNAIHRADGNQPS